MPAADAVQADSGCCPQRLCVYAVNHAFPAKGAQDEAVWQYSFACNLQKDLLSTAGNQPSSQNGHREANEHQIHGKGYIIQ